MEGRPMKNVEEVGISQPGKKTASIANIPQFKL
jgi:hypothetical protein